MDSHCHAAALAGIVLLIALAGCQSLDPVHDIRDSPVPAGSTAEDVYDAIVEGGAVRGWKIRPVEAGHAEGTLFVRSHVAVVDIYYDAHSYSIEYQASENLEYEDGKIHGNYNKWVDNLNGDIHRALLY